MAITFDKLVLDLDDLEEKGLGIVFQAEQARLAQLKEPPLQDQAALVQQHVSEQKIAYRAAYDASVHDVASNDSRIKQIVERLTTGTAQEFAAVAADLGLVIK